MSKYTTAFATFFNLVLVLFIVTIILYQENLSTTLTIQTPVLVEKYTFELNLNLDSLGKTKRIRIQKSPKPGPEIAAREWNQSKK